MAKNLSQITKIIENNESCVVLEVLPNSEKDLICLGCFNGNETMFRLTKGDNHTCTIWTNDGNNYSWEWGLRGYTLVNDRVNQQGKLIQSCILDDYEIYIGANKDSIKKSLYTKLPEHSEHYFKCMYWKGQRESQVCIHRNNDFYKHTDSLSNFINYLFSKGYEVQKIRDYKSPRTGCLIEEFSAVK